MDVATGKPTAEERAAVAPSPDRRRRSRRPLPRRALPDRRRGGHRGRSARRGRLAGRRRRHRALHPGAAARARPRAAGRPGLPRASWPSVAAREGRAALHARLADGRARGGAAAASERRGARDPRARAAAGGQPPPARPRRAGSVTDAPWRVTYVGLTLDRRGAGAPAGRARRVDGGGRACWTRCGQLLSRGYGAALPAMQGIGYRQFVEVARGRARRRGGAGAHAARHGALRQAADDVVRARAGTSRGSTSRQAAAPPGWRQRSQGSSTRWRAVSGEPSGT